ncbi:hypothetical protein AWW66_25235 [Micromonospora rosaria]|uniref:Twitching motility protein PilT n=1 Tax=Micromonospora rosaria TaxID=47874 RepID=A0A136PLM0_9ACTN|nr:hypothetical protein [Micromonospora rosaria]KXK59258.1 hypothetical protein AWW66_25235 [Micromonospora rosaria]
MSGYVLDDLALLAGLTGQEQHRRELSRLLHDAVGGGPRLAIPAFCLAGLAAEGRLVVATHLADIIAAAPAGTVEVCGLARTDRLEWVRTVYPWLPWPAAHATVWAQSVGAPILTVDPDRYKAVAVDVLSL